MNKECTLSVAVSSMSIMHLIIPSWNFSHFLTEKSALRGNEYVVQ